MSRACTYKDCDFSHHPHAKHTATMQPISLGAPLASGGLAQPVFKSKSSRNAARKAGPAAASGSCRSPSRSTAPPADPATAAASAPVADPVADLQVTSTAQLPGASAAVTSAARRGFSVVPSLFGPASAATSSSPPPVTTSSSASTRAPLRAPGASAPGLHQPHQPANVNAAVSSSNARGAEVGLLLLERRSSFSDAALAPDALPQPASKSKSAQSKRAASAAATGYRHPAPQPTASAAYPAGGAASAPAVDLHVASTAHQHRATAATASAAPSGFIVDASLAGFLASSSSGGPDSASATSGAQSTPAPVAPVALSATGARGPGTFPMEQLSRMNAQILYSNAGGPSPPAVQPTSTTDANMFDNFDFGGPSFEPFGASGAASSMSVEAEDATDAPAHPGDKGKGKARATANRLASDPGKKPLRKPSEFSKIKKNYVRKRDSTVKQVKKCIHQYGAEAFFVIYHPRVFGPNGTCNIPYYTVVASDRFKSVDTRIRLDNLVDKDDFEANGVDMRPASIDNMTFSVGYRSMRAIARAIVKDHQRESVGEESRRIIESGRIVAEAGRRHEAELRRLRSERRSERRAQRECFLAAGLDPAFIDEQMPEIPESDDEEDGGSGAEGQPAHLGMGVSEDEDEDDEERDTEGDEL